MSENNPYRLPTGAVPSPMPVPTPSAPSEPAQGTYTMPVVPATSQQTTSSTAPVEVLTTAGERLRAAIDSTTASRSSHLNEKDREKFVWKSRAAAILGFAAFITFFVIIGSWQSPVLFLLFIGSIVCGAMAMAWASMGVSEATIKNRNINFIAGVFAVSAGIIGFPIGLIVYFVSSIH